MIESVDLRRLQVLRLVHRHGTVTAAADVLHLTPSAVSHQLRQLARETGVALLEPDGRRVRLTAAGRALVTHADALHANWERARAELAAYADGSAESLHMCGFPSAVARLLAPAAARLRATDTRLTVHVAEEETAAGLDRLLAGETDIAVVVLDGSTLPLDDAKFGRRPVLAEPFDLIVPAGHPLAERDEAVLGDVADEPWVLAAAGSCDLYELAVAACSAAGFTPRVAHHARDYAAVSALVACGLGVALIPRTAAVPALHDVARLPLRDAPTRHVLACVRLGGDRRPAIARGLAALEEAGRELARLPERPDRR
ncbi:LysR family transcriptional regulator [Actinoallomurus oryzae]|uniref:LysR family transcriptional regulator n=1 Tax=Actinoallomurus oryzae TaxID=502180 RepID=A0ABP8Q6I9_9ACTN